MSEATIPPRVVRRYLNYMIVAAMIWCFFGASIGGPIFSGLLLALDLTKAQIGFVMSIGLLFLPMQMIGAILQQRFFHRKRFWMICVLVHYSSFLGISLLTACWLKLPASLALMVFMGTYALSQFSAQLSGAVGNAWAGEIIPPRESTAFWNRRSGAVLIASMVAGILMGKMVDILGKDNRSTYAIIMGVGVIFGYLSMFSNLVMRDPDPHPHKDGSPFLQIKSILGNRQFLWVTAFFSFQSMAGWVSSGFIFVYLQRDMSFSMTSIQILSAVSCLVGFASAYFFRIVGSKYGNKPILVLCSILKAGEFVLWGTLRSGNGFLDELGMWAINNISTTFNLGHLSLQPGLIGTLPVFMVGGFVNIGIGSSQMAIITSTGNKRDRSLSIGIFYSLVGISSFLVSSQSGLLYEYFDSLKFIQESSFNSFNVLSLITAVGYFLSVFIISNFREDGSASTTNVMRTIFSSNPVRSVYHAHLLSQPMTEGHRMETLRRAQGALISNELIKDLYSPSSRVRDGALLNVCRLEGKLPPELEAEVIKLIDIPEIGMQAMAARTLGRLRVGSAVPALLRHVDDIGDMALAQACIFSLGLIGDPAAENSLCAVLDNRRCQALWPLAAEALSRLGTGDCRHTRRIFMVLENESYWVLRQQTLISLCRLMLEDHSTAHTLFEAEEKMPGAEVEKRLRGICQHPLWAQLSLPPPSFEAAIGACDHDDYTGALDVVLPAMLSLYNIRPQHAGMTPAQFLSERFGNGRMRDAGLNHDTYPATNLWLQLKLWAELKYETDGRDRFLLLTALVAGERLLSCRQSFGGEL